MHTARRTAGVRVCAATTRADPPMALEQSGSRAVASPHSLSGPRRAKVRTCGAHCAKRRAHHALDQSAAPDRRDRLARRPILPAAHLRSLRRRPVPWRGRASAGDHGTAAVWLHDHHGRLSAAVRPVAVARLLRWRAVVDGQTAVGAGFDWLSHRLSGIAGALAARRAAAWDAGATPI